VREPSDREALQRLAARTDFLWHQRFELARGVVTTGASDVSFLFAQAGVPADLTGLSALDIGTTNGGAAFELERRGADPVVALDMTDDAHFGFRAISETLRSRVEFRTASVYELSRVLDRRFDIVLFWGVLYHLRHPLLALDNVRAITRGAVYIETAVCDHEAADLRDRAMARFYRLGELGADPSNWFAPNVAGLVDWCTSCGFAVDDVSAWPDAAPSRAMVAAHAAPGPPEYEQVSYERPLHCTVVPGV
jgi:tRNA (mo5U34)-methyltransferase